MSYPKAAEQMLARHTFREFTRRSQRAPKWPERCPTSGETLPKSCRNVAPATESGRSWPNLGRCWPNSVNIWPVPPQTVRVGPSDSRSGPECSQTRPNSTNIGHNVVESCKEQVGQLSPQFNQFGTKLAKHCRNSAQISQVGQCLSNSANVGRANQLRPDVELPEQLFGSCWTTFEPLRSSLGSFGVAVRVAWRAFLLPHLPGNFGLPAKIGLRKAGHIVSVVLGGVLAIARLRCVVGEGIRASMGQITQCAPATGRSERPEASHNLHLQPEWVSGWCALVDRQRSG